MCKDKSCECTKIKHRKCRSKDDLNDVINRIEWFRREVNQENRKAFNDVIEIYDDIIDKISM